MMSITWFFVTEMEITTMQVLFNAIHGCPSVLFPFCLLLQLFAFLCGLKYFFVQSISFALSLFPQKER